MGFQGGILGVVSHSAAIKKPSPPRGPCAIYDPPVSFILPAMAGIMLTVPMRLKLEYLLKNRVKCFLIFF